MSGLPIGWYDDFTVVFSLDVSWADSVVRVSILPRSLVAGVAQSSVFLGGVGVGMALPGALTGIRGSVCAKTLFMEDPDWDFICATRGFVVALREGTGLDSNFEVAEDTLYFAPEASSTFFMIFAGVRSSSERAVI